MSKFKEFKQKVKDNKYKIIAGTITIAGVVYVIVKQNGQIKELQLISNDEKTIYLSITELPFEIGKTYLLQQWVNII